MQSSDACETPAGISSPVSPLEPVNFMDTLELSPVVADTSPMDMAWHAHAPRPTQSAPSSRSVQAPQQASFSRLVASRPSAEPPIIEWASSSKHVQLGKPELLRVRALGLPSVSYQWYFKGEPIVAAVNAELALPSVTVEQCGAYFCKVGPFFVQNPLPIRRPGLFWVMLCWLLLACLGTHLLKCAVSVRF
jgi:hypothetical protein